MNQLTGFLKSQTADVYNWTNKLIENIAFEKWVITPAIVETNLAWQLGHLTLSQYYYTVVLVTGPRKDFAEDINLKKYSGLFANGHRIKELPPEITVQELITNWNAVQMLTNEILSSLQDIDLAAGVFNLPKPHPFVKTKEQAVSWNIKHTMWHCGQIATLRRVIDVPFSFGM
ncbi:MAG: DinB family protein [Ferruginibacter sp.]